MKKGQLKSRIMKLALYLELILAFFITIAVIIGMTDLAKYVVLILRHNPKETYDVFQNFLGHVLLLVIGIELVAMLVMHTPSSVIEVLLYAVARHMLIYSKGTYDFIFGIASIAGIFAIRKFLFVSSLSGSEGSNVFSAAVTIPEVNSIMGVNIPESIASTIGGVVSHISKESCRQIYEGALFCVSDAEIKVLKIRDGVIEQVAVTECAD